MNGCVNIITFGFKLKKCFAGIMVQVLQIKIETKTFSVTFYRKFIFNEIH